MLLLSTLVVRSDREQEEQLQWSTTLCEGGGWVCITVCNQPSFFQLYYIKKSHFSVVQVWGHLSVRGLRNWSLQLRVALITLPCSPFYRKTLCSTAWMTPSPAWYVNTNTSFQFICTLGFYLCVVKSSLVLHNMSEICCQSNRSDWWCFWRWCSVLCSQLSMTSSIAQIHIPVKVQPAFLG